MMYGKQTITLLFPEIKELLQAKDYVLLRQVLKDSNPIGLADFWDKLTPEEHIEIFKLLPPQSSLKLFEMLKIEDQQSILSRLDDAKVTPLLENVSSPELAKIFHQMTPRSVKKMKDLIKRQEALARIDLVMQYPENSAGGKMHPEFIKLGPRLTARQALSILQAIARPNQKWYLFYLFVTASDGKILGSLSLQDLLAAPEHEQLSELMTSVEPYKVRPETDQEEVALLFSKFNLGAAPVVDENDKLIGVITARDILEVQRQEASEDITKMVGTSTKALDLHETSVFKTVWYRTPWLVVTLLGEMVVSIIIKHYEPVLAKVIALASFSPLISAMGGNVGAQSATIVVRSIALGEIKTRAEKMRTVLHEFKVGILLGTLYGVTLGIMAYILYGERYHWQFGMSVMIGMGTSMTVASTMGALEPIFFHRIGVDPATATGPLITTITDIISNLVYYTLATFLLLKMAVI